LKTQFTYRLPSPPARRRRIEPDTLDLAESPHPAPGKKNDDFRRAPPPPLRTARRFFLNG
jgi:hypothetical protein